MDNGLVRLEVNFPCCVVVTEDDKRVLSALADEICKRYERSHPGRVMWPFGQGFKMMCHPMMLSDDEPIPFDESCYEVECSEREDYSWPCAKCGIEQGEHASCITEPKAGACEFEPVKKDLGPEPVMGVVPMHVYLSAVHGRRELRAALREARERIKELESLAAMRAATGG